MLDKSVPYAGIYMRRKAGTPLPGFALPDGYRFVFYRDGDEADWARIETSVLEFDSEFAALLYFKEEYMPHVKELRERCIFIESEAGAKVATATAWWHDVRGQRRGWLHWIAVEPGHQGLGLGKAVVSRATERLCELNGDVDLYLHTQTWSHKAVGIYKAHGYVPTDEKALYTEKKDNYKRAMRILRRINC